MKSTKASSSRLPAIAETLRARDHVDKLRVLHQNAQLDLEALQDPAVLFGAAPYVAIWDSHADSGADSCAMLRRIDFPPTGNPAVSLRSALPVVVVHSHSLCTRNESQDSPGASLRIQW
jgi:hypothetical protein